MFRAFCSVPKTQCASGKEKDLVDLVMECVTESAREDEDLADIVMAGLKKGYVVALNNDHEVVFSKRDDTDSDEEEDEGEDEEEDEEEHHEEEGHHAAPPLVGGEEAFIIPDDDEVFQILSKVMGMAPASEQQAREEDKTHTVIEKVMLIGGKKARVKLVIEEE